MPPLEERRLPWINYAACIWALLFAAPHIWWALGIPAGFPGGEDSYRFFVSSWWRYLFDIVVVLLCATSIAVALVLTRPAGSILPRWMARTAAWIAFAMLTLRGAAGMIVDGSRDPVWWPTFLVGGLLFGAVAWRARRPLQPAV